MQFIAEYTVDEMDFLSFVRINRYIRGKVPRRLITIVTAAASVLLAALCVLLTLRGAWTAKNAIIVAIGVMLIGWELRRDRYYANENRRKMTGYVEKMQLSANERGIDISSDGNVEHVDYKRIEAIYHCRESLSCTWPTTGRTSSPTARSLRAPRRTLPHTPRRSAARA